MESIPLNLTSCSVLWAFLETFTSSWWLTPPPLQESSIWGSLELCLRIIQTQRAEDVHCALSVLVLSWICFISLSEAVAGSSHSRHTRSCQAGTSCSFSMATAWSKGHLLSLWKAPVVAEDSQLSLLLSLCTRGFGARSGGQRDSGLHSGFFVGDGLRLFCALKSWILCPAWLEGLRVPHVGAHEAAHQVAKVKIQHFSCVHGAKWDFFSHFTVV